MDADDFTEERLLASFWLARDQDHPGEPLHQLTRFAEDKGLQLPDDVLRKAARRLDNDLAGRDVEGRVVFFGFCGHPRAVWNFMIDAVAAAERDEHLQKIATGLAEHLLAHCGSLAPLFEFWSGKDLTFKRMPTGCRRHRMSDDVWMRLRGHQAQVADPLPAMVPLDLGVEYMAPGLSAEDRATADKGLWRRDPDGSWQRPRRGRE